MRRRIFGSSSPIELSDARDAGDGGPWLRFRDRAATTVWLGPRLAAPAALTGVRVFLAAAAPWLPLRSMGDAEVVGELARLLVHGTVRAALVARPALHGKDDRQVEEQASAPASAPTRELHWFEVVLLDDDGEPVAGERFQATLADGRVVNGRLDGTGRARWDDIASAGSCTISFPDLDAAAKGAGEEAS
jgi:hypothetical protein